MINRLKLFSIIITAIRWKNHYRRWKSVNKIHVKYEDLLVDPHRVINSILDYLVIENTESQLIDDAINIFSFQNLTGRKPGEIDNSNLEFRTGTSGSYKNVFNKLEKYLFRIICGHVAKDAGYSL